MKIYVGNLSSDTNEADLTATFAPHGDVQSAKLITDRETGASRGFGFVEMGDEAARGAIGALNGVDLKGRALKVNEATPREPRAGGFRPKRF